MIKNWRTSLLGILGALVILATSKGWIDNDIAVAIGSVLTALFGISAKDGVRLEDGIGGRPDDR